MSLAFKSEPAINRGVSSPDQAISGNEVEVICKFTYVKSLKTQSLISRHGLGEVTLAILTTSKLQLTLVTGVFVSRNFTFDALTLVEGQTYEISVQGKSNDGAGNRSAEWFFRNANGTWASQEVDTVSGAETLMDLSFNWAVGSDILVFTESRSIIHEVEVWQGEYSTGTLLLDFKPERDTVIGAVTWTSDNGEVWTVNYPGANTVANRGATVLASDTFDRANGVPGSSLVGDYPWALKDADDIAISGNELQTLVSTNNTWAALEVAKYYDVAMQIEVDNSQDEEIFYLRQDLVGSEPGLQSGLAVFVTHADDGVKLVSIADGNLQTVIVDITHVNDIAINYSIQILVVGQRVTVYIDNTLAINQEVYQGNWAKGQWAVVEAGAVSGSGVEFDNLVITDAYEARAGIIGDYVELQSSVIALASSDTGKIVWSGDRNVWVSVSEDSGVTWNAATNGGDVYFGDPSPDTVVMVSYFVEEDIVGGFGELQVSFKDRLFADPRGTVTYTYTKSSPGEGAKKSQVRKQANVKLIEPLPDWLDIPNQFFRPWVEIQSPYSQEWIRFWLGKFVATLPSRQDYATHRDYDLGLADRTHSYASQLTDDFVQSPELRNIVLYVREDILVTIFGETDFDFPATTDVIPDNIIHDPNTSWLDVMNKALQSAGWENLSINNNGDNTATPASVDVAPTWVFPYESPIIEKAVIRADQAEVPNVVQVKPKRAGPTLPVVGNGIAVFKNFDDGPHAINNVGKEILKEITVEATDQPELERIGALEAQFLFLGGGDQLKLKVGLQPLLDDRDVVSMVKPGFGITETDDWWVTGWKVNLSDSPSALDLMDLTLQRKVVTFGVAGYSGSTTIVATPTVAGGGGGGGDVNASGTYNGNTLIIANAVKGTP